MEFQIWGMEDEAVIYDDGVEEYRLHGVNAYLHIRYGSWRLQDRMYSLN